MFVIYYFNFIFSTQLPASCFGLPKSSHIQYISYSVVQPFNDTVILLFAFQLLSLNAPYSEYAYNDLFKQVGIATVGISPAANSNIPKSIISDI